MRVHALVYLFCSCLIAMLAAGCSSDNDTSLETISVSTSVKLEAQRLANVLKAKGYEVTSGHFKLYTKQDCDDYSYKVMGSCYGNNPAAPYILTVVKSWPKEYLDPATRYAFGYTDEGESGSFRLDPREAIVIFGQMPPPAAYFGLQTYLFTREDTFKTDSAAYLYIAANFPAMLNTFFQTVPNNNKRIVLFASLGNSNNNVVVQNQSGSFFNQKHYFVITPDRYMDKAVREALAEISVSGSAVFSEPIPSTTRIGLGESADEFMFLMRYAMPQDGGGSGTQSDKWRTNLPLAILRIRDPNTSRSPEPYGPPALEKRLVNDESWLASDLAKLVAEVSSRWGQPCTTEDCSDRASDLIDLQGEPISMIGPLCTEIGMNCVGDTQDASYHGTVNLDLDNGEVYALAGTLATETGNATYVGLSINESLRFWGAANIDSDQLKNTASAYSSLLYDSTKFYLYYFTRDCSSIKTLAGDNCFSITTDMIEPCTSTDPSECDHLKLAQRAYIKNGTQRGPDSTRTMPPYTPPYLLKPKLIKLNVPN